MLLKAYLPDLSASLGIFIPLIVVNCIILARAEAFASKNTVGLSALDGLGMGAGFSAGACHCVGNPRDTWLRYNLGHQRCGRHRPYDNVYPAAGRDF